MVNKKLISKKGWNWEAFWKSFYWYGKKGMTGQTIIMVILVFGSVGIGLIPIMFYCGLNGNRDFYNHVKKTSFII
ncbi:hypothetical protein HYG86_18105 [Alkalicella caledoniensis]|uniref:Uncharacterized protein n=1 Tax=Alkalicella caledoniensis TaxID=2731377 RepID=A0A7G9WCY7_ALKCA|nr:hypothetical protein [Alkalicella caledoniensis]QNO16549.1 hypothetical protein HYG86_18105 [Alkalicella caledoniensis]